MPIDLLARLRFLADTLETRATVERSADDSPAVLVSIPAREVIAAIEVLREAAAVLGLLCNAE